MRWMKENWCIVLIGVVTACGLTAIIWFYATHTCIAWEDVPTGEKCVNWTTDTYTTIGMDGKMETKTRQRCTEYVPCRQCMKWVRDEEVGEKPIKPKDRC